MTMTRPRAGHQVGLLSFAEIGSRLGITRQTAQQCCNRGLSKLRDLTPNTVELLREYAEEDIDRRERKLAHNPRG